MAIPFKSNITVPNSWEIKDERNSSIYKVTYASGSQSRTTDIYGGNTFNLKIGNVNVATFNTNNVNFGTTGLPTNIKGNSVIINDVLSPTTINGATINIGSSNTSLINIGNSNNKININTMNLSINTANGWTINNTTGTSGQVLTSNGAAATPTWQNLPKFHFWKYSNNRWIDESYPEITKWTATSTDRYDIDAELFGITNFEDKSQYQFGFVVAEISATGHFYKSGNVGVAHTIVTRDVPIFFTPEMNGTKVGGDIYALNPQDNSISASTTYSTVGEFEFYIEARTQGSSLVLDAKINFLHGPSSIVNFIIDDLTGCTLTGGFIFK